MDILLDGSKAILSENRRYRGAGMVSANNSSRLLLDYKCKHPDVYQNLLAHIFSSSGLYVSHLKIEMGSDINSSSGTEPAIMRSSTEPADVTRGSGFQLAHDAKRVNPDLTLDMLWWSEPRWVSDTENVYEARYHWYRQNLLAAHETYGLIFDYVSANQNERALEPEWIKYLRYRLDNDPSAPYDFSAIQIVGADEDCKWDICTLMLDDLKLQDAIQVIGSHYTSWTSTNVDALMKNHQKEIWFAEGCPPMGASKARLLKGGLGSGLAGTNGELEIAVRILTMFRSGMTLYEYQPVISAYYDGATFCCKELIEANTPWSGHYKLTNGYFMQKHFSSFIKKGWALLPEASQVTGTPTGDGHGIEDTTGGYVTFMDPDSRDYTMVFVNYSDTSRTITLTTKELSDAPFNIYETRYDELDHPILCTFVGTLSSTTTASGPDVLYRIPPYSITTFSTLQMPAPVPDLSRQNQVLTLPYTDDFTYSDEEADFLKKRGGAPRYTTDQGGAFEVVEKDGAPVLMQMITESMRAKEWGATPEPVTCFGDDRLLNYTIDALVSFDPAIHDPQAYIGIGLRYVLAAKGHTGYWLRLWNNGEYALQLGDLILKKGRLKKKPSGKIRLTLTAEADQITGFINHTTVCSETSYYPGYGAGRAALFSSYHNHCFHQISLIPGSEEVSVERLDNISQEIHYYGSWEHETMGSFLHYDRTLSLGQIGAFLDYSFLGSGIGILGYVQEDTQVKLQIDDQPVETLNLSACAERSLLYLCHSLPRTTHQLKLQVLNGTFGLDAIELMGKDLMP